MDYTDIDFLMQEVFSDELMGERKHIDILAKARLSGEEGVILIHIEPQSEKESQFARRMFRYYARLFLKHDLKILPIAVLAHKVKKEEAKKFEISFSFHEILKFEFMQLHLIRKNWRDYLKKDNPAAAALMSCMNYTEAEKKQIKVEFLKMLLRLKLDPARMQLLMGFFDTYLVLNEEEEAEVKQALKEELPPEEVKEMAEILTAYHKMGIKEGIKEGTTALQNTLIKQSRRKLGHLSLETEQKIREIESVALLEEILENIFDFDSEEDLIMALHKNNKP